MCAVISVHCTIKAEDGNILRLNQYKSLLVSFLIPISFDHQSFVWICQVICKQNKKAFFVSWSGWLEGGLRARGSQGCSGTMFLCSWYSATLIASWKVFFVHTFSFPYTTKLHCMVFSGVYNPCLNKTCKWPLLTSHCTYCTLHTANYKLNTAHKT